MATMSAALVSTISHPVQFVSPISQANPVVSCSCQSTSQSNRWMQSEPSRPLAKVIDRKVKFHTSDRSQRFTCAADVAVVSTPEAETVTDGAAASSQEAPAVPEVPIELRFEAYPTVMDINQIRDILPHRYPFLLVDRVIELTPGVSAVAIKQVTINDNFFPGHFPERPIMPGVLMVEAMAQVGGIVMLNPEVGGSKENFFFAGVDKVRFRKPVVAGDTLVMRMTLIKLQKRFGIAKMEGKAYVGKDVVCEGEFLMALGS
eukprot:TRINITY_DN5953_c0_g2_i1.p1 TRINITY_DN5953_c0_g2~~TRINITY_DN5953_c0_g2_i1.p1  ORF type:complete len:260 (-),score=52.74 TRINITY_DN5953_c0_g2_i1:591-1370(-)